MTTERAAADAPQNAEVGGGLSARGDRKTYPDGSNLVDFASDVAKPGVISPFALGEEDALVFPFARRALPALWSTAL